MSENKNAISLSVIGPEADALWLEAIEQVLTASHIEGPPPPIVVGAPDDSKDG